MAYEDLTRPSGGTTFGEGRRNSGKNRGLKGARDRLWSNEFGGGFLDRQILDPAMMDYMYKGATGATRSPGQILGEAMLGQNAAQAYAMGAAGGGASNPGLMMNQAQNANTNATMQSVAQFGAMEADWRNQMAQSYMNAQMGQQAMNDQAALGREQLLQNYITGGAQQRMQQQQQDQWWKGMLGNAASGAVSGLATGASAALLMSDERVKTDIQLARQEVDEVLKAIEPLSFKYIGSRDAQLGVVTRDLKKTKLGASTVVEANGFEGIDVRKGLSLVLAAVARLSQRLDELEKRHG